MIEGRHHHRRSRALLPALAVVSLIGSLLGQPLPAAAAEACTPAKPASPGLQTRNVQFGGETRSYRLHIPASYNGTDPAPLVFGFHGMGGRNTGFESNSDLPSQANARGYVVVTPNSTKLDSGVAGYWGDMAAVVGQVWWWNYHSTMGVRFTQPDPMIPPVVQEPGTPQDVDFVRSVLDDLEAELCLDPDRFFATGHSNGGGFTTTLGCEAADRFAAIGAVAGINLTSACRGSGPLAVATVHGTSDTAVGYYGNLLLGNVLPNPAVPDRMQQWADDVGCTGPYQDQAVGGTTTRTWSGCPTGIDVELMTINGWGHNWHSSATPYLLDFFDAHPRPAPPVQGAIGGTVTDQATAQPLEGISVRHWTAADGWSAQTFTDATGAYSLSDLAPGDYKLRFNDPVGGVYTQEFWDDQTSLAAASTIAVTAGATATADAALAGPPASAGTIAGTVTDDGTAQPLEGISVRLWSAGAGWFSRAWTDASGGFSFDATAPGDYVVRFDDPYGSHLREFWDDQTTFGAADQITVTAGDTTTIDAALVP